MKMTNRKMGVVLAVAIGVGFLGFMRPAAAEMAHEQEGMEAEVTGQNTLESIQAAPSKNADGTVNLNNQLCPVSGDKVSGKDSAAQGGASYNLCCSMCSSKLQKNPGKFAVTAAEIQKAVA